MWSEIVKLRCHRNVSSMRSIIMADLENQPLNQRRNHVSATSSDASNRSLAHSSMQSGNSSNSSRASSRTDTYVHFEVDDDVGQQSTFSVSATSGIGAIPFPDPPSIITSARGQRRAPEGKCFVCPSKVCKGKAYFKRVGDWTNHIEKTHKVSPWHDPSRFLRQDPRSRAAQQAVDSEAPEEAAALLRSDVNADMKPGAGLGSSPVKKESQIQAASASEVALQNDKPVQFNTMMSPAGHYGNTGVEFLDEDVLYQQQPEHQELSWFDHNDNMQQ